MAQVVSNLSSVPPSDIRAIATYMAGVFGAPTPDRKRQGEAVLAQVRSPSAQAPKGDAAGAAIYAAACATCHETRRTLPYPRVHPSPFTPHPLPPPPPH